MLGAAATSVELALSGTVPLSTVLPAMLGVHALIGIGEAVVTVAAVAAVLASRPDLIWAREVSAYDFADGAASSRRESEMRLSTKLFIVLALAVAVGLATAVSPYASASPDGLEKVAGDKGFARAGDAARDPGRLADRGLRVPGDRRRAPRHGPRRLRRHARRLRDRLRPGMGAAPARRRLEGGAVAGGRAL